MDPLLIISDTEVDTSAELEVNLPLHRTNVSKRTTMFNITLTDDDIQVVHETAEWKKYETKLQQEMKEWLSTYTNSMQQYKHAKQQLRVDVSILPAEKAAFLKNTPNMQMYLRQSLACRLEALLFLKQDYRKICDMQDNLKELCKFHTNIAKTKKWRQHYA